MKKYENVIHFITLFVLSGAFIPLWRSMSGAGTNLAEGDPLHRVLLLFAYIMTLPILFLNPRMSIKIILSIPWIGVIVGLALMSSFWSVLPALTIRRSFALLLTSLYAVAIVFRFSFYRFISLLGGVLWSTLSISVVFAVLIPDWGTMMYEQNWVWRGIFIHKNSLGNISALSLLIFGYLAINSSGLKKRILWGCGIILAIITLWKSQSLTGYLLVVWICSGAALLMGVLITRKSFTVLFLPLIFSAIGFIWLLFKNYGEILSYFGKDITLTGRLPLWDIVWKMGLEKPWVGYGYGAFWSGWEGPSAFIWYMFPTWQPDHAHNGYLDTFIYLGFVGLTVVLVFLGALFTSQLVCVLKGRATAIFGVILIGILILQNISESSLVRQNSLWWVLLISIYFYLNHRRIYQGEQKNGA